MGRKRHGAFSQIFTHTLYFDVLGYPRSGQGGEGTARLYVGAMWGLFLSGLLSGILASELPATVFAAVLLSFGGFLSAIRIVADVGDGFMSPADEGVLGHLPIRSSTYFWARISGLGMLLLFHAGHQAIVPAVVLSVTSNSGWWGSVSYLISAILMIASIAGLIIVAYMIVIRWLSPRRIREWLMWAQVAGTSVTFGLVFLLPSLGRLQDFGGDVLDGPVSFVIPTLWFAHLFGVLSGEGGRIGPCALAVALPILSIIPLLIVARGYQGALSKLKTAPRQRRPLRLWADFVQKLIPCDQRPYFFFALRNMRRDRGFRVRSYPLVIFPLMILILGRHQEDLFLVLMAYLPALYLPFFTAFLPYTDTPEGAWIFPVLPIESPRAVQLGAHAALVAALIIPTYALIFLLLAGLSEWTVWMAAVHSATACLMASVFAVWDIRSLRDLPFTEPFSPSIIRPDMGAGIYLRLLFLGALGFAQAFYVTDLALGLLGLLVTASILLFVRRSSTAQAREVPA